MIAYRATFIYRRSLGLIVELTALSRRFKVTDRPLVGDIVDVYILSLVLFGSCISWLIRGIILNTLSI